MSETVIGGIISLLLSVIPFKATSIGIIIAALSLFSLFLIYRRKIENFDELIYSPYEEIILDLFIITIFVGNISWKQIGYLSLFIFLPPFLVGYYMAKMIYRWCLLNYKEEQRHWMTYIIYILFLLFSSLVIYSFLINSYVFLIKNMEIKEYNQSVLSLIISSVVKSFANIVPLLSKMLWMFTFALSFFLLSLAVISGINSYISKKKFEEVFKENIKFARGLVMSSHLAVSIVFLFLLILPLTVSFFISEITIIKNQIIIFHIKTPDGRDYFLIDNKLEIPINVDYKNKTSGKLLAKYWISEKSKCKILRDPFYEDIYVFIPQLSLSIYYNISRFFVISNPEILSNIPNC